MGQSSSTGRRKSIDLLPALALLFAVFLAASIAAAQDIPLGVTYVCNGEHIYIENCNIRDLSDNANCMVAHPDKLLPNGMNSYTYVTRGSLKKLLPTGATQKDQFGNLYDAAGNRVPGNDNAGHTVFSPRRATCPALNLSSKGASAGIQTMQTDLPKTMFGGDKGPRTPPGIRMHGIYAASTGFSVQFYPESVILGCGPDAARAYPYTVIADGAASSIKIDAPDHPLRLAFRADGALDAGAGSY